MIGFHKNKTPCKQIQGAISELIITVMNHKRKPRSEATGHKGFQWRLSVFMTKILTELKLLINSH